MWTNKVALALMPPVFTRPEISKSIFDALAVTLHFGKLDIAGTVIVSSIAILMIAAIFFRYKPMANEIGKEKANHSKAKRKSRVSSPKSARPKTRSVRNKSRKKVAKLR